MRYNSTNGRLLLSPCRCCAGWVLPQWVLPQWVLPWWVATLHTLAWCLVRGCCRSTTPCRGITSTAGTSWPPFALTHSTPLLAADYMHEPLPVDNTTLHDLGFEALPFLSNDAVSEILVYCGALLRAVCAPPRTGAACGCCMWVLHVGAACWGCPPQRPAARCSAALLLARCRVRWCAAAGLANAVRMAPQQTCDKATSCPQLLPLAGFAMFFVWALSPFVTRRKSFHFVVLIKRALVVVVSFFYFTRG